MHKSVTIYLRDDVNTVVKPSAYIERLRKKKSNYTKKKTRVQIISENENKQKVYEADNEESAIIKYKKYLKEILRDHKNEQQETKDHGMVYDFLSSFVFKNPIIIPDEVKRFNELNKRTTFVKNGNRSIFNKVIKCFNNFLNRICFCKRRFSKVEPAKSIDDFDMNIDQQSTKKTVKWKDQEEIKEKSDREYQLFVLKTYEGYSNFQKVMKECRDGNYEFNLEACSTEEKKGKNYEKMNELKMIKLLIDKHDKYITSLTYLTNNKY